MAISASADSLRNYPGRELEWAGLAAESRLLFPSESESIWSPTADDTIRRCVERLSQMIASAELDDATLLAFYLTALIAEEAKLDVNGQLVIRRGRGHLGTRVPLPPRLLM